MAFTPPSRTVQLVFPEGDELHGLEITARKLNVGQVREIAGTGTVSDELFIEHVTEWNLGVPVGVDGLLGFEVEDVKRVKSAWYEAALGRVPAPLSETSPSGELSEVASLPMESL